MDDPNDNVVSVRLPMETVDRVPQLALRFQTHRSGVIREAVAEYVRRHPA